MTPKLSEEIHNALEEQPGRPLEVSDAQSQKVYVVVAKEDFQRMVDEELRRQLQIGLDQADRGELEEWNLDEFLQRMRDQQHAKPA